jgi:hypothetical protein
MSHRIITTIRDTRAAAARSGGLYTFLFHHHHRVGALHSCCHIITWRIVHNSRLSAEKNFHDPGDNNDDDNDQETKGKNFSKSHDVA